jgi:sugar lactone lactonase YvrE
MQRRVSLSLLVAGCVLLTALTAAARFHEPVLVYGAPLAGSSNGLAFDSEDRLYIANVWAGTITTMNADTGDILQVYGPDYGLAFADDVAIGPDGALYFTLEGPAGEVGRISPDGERSTLAMLPFANPLAFSDDGRLFAAQCFGPENGLYEIDPEGVSEPRLIFGGLPGCAVNAFDFGPDGFLYAPSPYEGRIVRIDVDSGEVTTILDGLAGPAAVEFDSQGRLHFAEFNTGEVYRVDLETLNREKLATLEVGLDNLAFDSQDRLYVSSAVDGFIIEVLFDGTIRVVSAGGMVAPGGIAVQGDSLFVAEPSAIRVFDRQTGGQTALERSVFGVSDLGTPVTVSADGDDLILTSWFDSSVRIWNAETREIKPYMDFAVPINAIRFRGDLIVAELGTASIVRASGDNLSERETLATLTVPAGLAATGNDLWISDWATGTVWQLVADGETLSEPREVATGFAFPEGLAVTPDGQLVLIETGTGNLVTLDPDSGETSIIGEGLAVEPPPPPDIPLPPTLWFSGVAVGDDGAIYASGRVFNVIYRYEAGE